MKLEMVGKKENKALERTEVEFTIKDTKITPNRKEVRAKIAALLNAKEELVVITGISHSFGGTDSEAKANVYENEATLKKTEPKYLVERTEGKKEKKKEEAKPAEAAKEGEKPAEKKEEAGEKAEAKPAEKKEGQAKPTEAAEEKPAEKAGEQKEAGK